MQDVHRMILHDTRARLHTTDMSARPNAKAPCVDIAAVIQTRSVEALEQEHADLVQAIEVLHKDVHELKGVLDTLHVRARNVQAAALGATELYQPEGVRKMLAVGRQ